LIFEQKAQILLIHGAITPWIVAHVFMEINDSPRYTVFCFEDVEMFHIFDDLPNSLISNKGDIHPNAQFSCIRALYMAKCIVNRMNNSHHPLRISFL
jgi:hypothetical protein